MNTSFYRSFDLGGYFPMMGISRQSIKNAQLMEKLRHSTSPAKQQDTVTISKEAKEAQKKTTSTAHQNTAVDKQIDLQAHVDAAKKANAEALEHAGTSIDRNAVKYTGTIDALRSALKEKYGKLSAQAGSYGNVEDYLQDKYFNRNSPRYEAGLTEDERAIGYRNEKKYLKNGGTAGVNLSDSLFRGVTIDGDVVDNDRLQFERAVINRQISNIMKEAGISEDAFDGMELTVDPYSHEISAAGVDEATKAVAEKALNVGDNGKNLFKHICHMATQDSANSMQITKDSYMKFQAAARVREMTDQRLDQMEQRGGTFYTQDGEDVLDAVDRGIQERVPAGYQDQMREWIHSLVSSVANRGWNNIPDMKLSIMLSKHGLVDIGQNIIYDGKTALHDPVWYSVF